jgi:hypothetical protein
MQENESPQAINSKINNQNKRRMTNAFIIKLLIENYVHVARHGAEHL